MVNGVGRLKNLSQSYTSHRRAAVWLGRRQVARLSCSVPQGKRTAWNVGEKVFSVSGTYTSIAFDNHGLVASAYFVDSECW